jgi:hypothetical protein
MNKPRGQRFPPFLQVHAQLLRDVQMESRLFNGVVTVETVLSGVTVL